MQIPHVADRVRQQIKRYIPHAAKVLSWQRQAAAEDQRLSAHGSAAVRVTAEECRVVHDRRDLLRLLPRGGCVAEVGVALGDFSQNILDICAPAQFHLIDLWGSVAPGKLGTATGLERVKTRFAPGIAAGRVVVHQGWSAEQIAMLPPASLDWIYIDGGHDYDTVREDLEAALPKLKDGGRICGHDYIRWGARGLSRFGVVEAVNEFCVAHDWEITCLSNEPHRHVSYILQRPLSPSR